MEEEEDDKHRARDVVRGFEEFVVAVSGDVSREGEV